jgi:hypothetical protein
MDRASRNHSTGKRMIADLFGYLDERQAKPLCILGIVGSDVRDDLFEIPNRSRR